MAQFYERLKKTNNPYLQIRKTNTNFSRLVYRPYHNDVIKVKQFSKIEWSCFILLFDLLILSNFIQII